MANQNLAIVSNNLVENIIVGDPAQLKELSAALGKEVVYVPEYPLAIGDMRVGENWTRNVNGVQTILDARPTYDELEAAVNDLYSTLEGGGAE